jgi:hypothetical protein
MKSIRILTLTLAVATLALPTSSFAAKGNKAEKGNKPGKIAREYDTDGNGAIDGTEVEGFRKAFDADKAGPLKQFDKDADGTLSDSEIAAVKIHAKGKGGKKKNK